MAYYASIKTGSAAQSIEMQSNQQHSATSAHELIGSRRHSTGAKSICCNFVNSFRDWDSNALPAHIDACNGRPAVHTPRVRSPPGGGAATRPSAACGVKAGFLQGCTQWPLGASLLADRVSRATAPEGYRHPGRRLLPSVASPHFVAAGAPKSVAAARLPSSSLRDHGAKACTAGTSRMQA